jgi:5'-nucleotidase / UDP-sugar diphosphatase
MVCYFLFFHLLLTMVEFDFGEARLAELMDMSNFPWLGSNIRYASDRKLFHTIRDIDYFDLPTTLPNGTNGPLLRVGVFGVCTQATPNLSSPTEKIIFEDVIEHSQRCVTILKSEHSCDIVIAMTHISLFKDKDLAEIVPGIDLIVGGHDHDPAMLVQQKTMIVKCGQNIDYIGLVDLRVHCNFTPTSSDSIFTTIDSSSSEKIPRNVTVHTSFQLISMESLKSLSPTPLPTDPLIDSIVESYQSHSSKLRSLLETETQVIVSVVETLSDPSLQSSALSTLSSDVRSCETAFACWVADAMVWYYRSHPTQPIHCDFGMINGGFIRGNNEYPQGSPILVDTILEEMPFPRKPTLISLLGKNILQGLEEMLAVSNNPVGCYPHLSHGIRVVYDMNLPPMSRIQLCEVLEQNESSAAGEEIWKPIDIYHYYSMVVSDFYVFKQGDNVTSFYQQAVLQESSQAIGSVALEYFKTLKTIGVVAPGRLKRLN